MQKLQAESNAAMEKTQRTTGKTIQVERLSANGTWMMLGAVSSYRDCQMYHFTDLHPYKGSIKISHFDLEP